MTYHELVQLFFERSNALQWYWNLFVVVIGGLLAFSLFRQRRDLIKTALITVLFSMFAYKNLDAIYDVTVQRFAVLQLLNEFTPAGPNAADVNQARAVLDPTLGRATLDWANVRNFHLASDLLTIITIWVMEWHRKKDD